MGKTRLGCWEWIRLGWVGLWTHNPMQPNPTCSWEISKIRGSWALFRLVFAHFCQYLQNYWAHFKVVDIVKLVISKASQRRLNRSSFKHFKKCGFSHFDGYQTPEIENFITFSHTFLVVSLVWKEMIPLAHYVRVMRINLNFQTTCYPSTTPILENPEYQTRWYFKYFLGRGKRRKLSFAQNQVTCSQERRQLLVSCFP